MKVEYLNENEILITVNAEEYDVLDQVLGIVSDCEENFDILASMGEDAGKLGLIIFREKKARGVEQYGGYGNFARDLLCDDDGNRK